MELLGEALTVKQVAALIGCSPWTVRQKHIPRGLPCFRSGAWKAAVRRAGIRPFRFKDLRATFNSRLIEAGVIKDVRKELMGHSRNEDTNDLYSHIELPLLREAIAKLEAWRERQIQMNRKEVHGQTLGATTDLGNARNNPGRGNAVGSTDGGPSPGDPAKQVSTGIQTV